MWMCYMHVSRPPAMSVVSAVERLRSVFSNIEFECEHEIVYGFGRYGTDEELQIQIQLYSDAAAMCDDYIHGNLSISCLVSKLDGMNFQTYTVEIKKFLKNGGSENGSKNKV